MRTILESSRSSSPLIALYTSRSVSLSSDMVLSFDCFFYFPYLIEPHLVPPAFEFRREPGPQDVARDAPADHALAHDQDVGVVVLPAHLRREMVMAERGAH